MPSSVSSSFCFVFLELRFDSFSDVRVFFCGSSYDLRPREKGKAPQAEPPKKSEHR